MEQQELNNIKKLKDLGYYDAWKRNLIKYSRQLNMYDTHNYQIDIRERLMWETWRNVINAFPWSSTPEGANFWSYLHAGNFDKAREIWNTKNA
jgi:hypothetical protein